MSLTEIRIVDRNECVGNSLSSINTNFEILSSQALLVANRIEDIATQFSEISSIGVSKLIAGQNVVLNPSSGRGNVVISANLPGSTGQEVLSGVNIGSSGARVFKQKTSSRALEFRRIVSGSVNLAVSEENDVIKITSLNKDGEPIGEVNTSSNIGNGVGLAATKQGANLPFKSLVAGRGTEILSSSDSVTINSTVSASNIGTNGSHGVFKSSNDNAYTPFLFKGIRAGNNIEITNNPTDIIINSTISLSGTHAITVGNIGGTIFKEKSGNNFVFKNIQSKGPGIAIINSANVIEISALDITKGNNLGTGAGIYSSTNDGTLNFKSLLPGTFITLSPRGVNEIEIKAVIPPKPGYDGISLGTGSRVFKEQVGRNLNFRTLSAGFGVSIKTEDTVLSFSVTGVPINLVPQVSATNLQTSSTTIGVLSSVNNSVLSFKSLSATGKSIVVSEENGVIKIDSPNAVVNGTNLGTQGVNVFKEKTEQGNLSFKKIKAGSGITINANENDTEIQINSLNAVIPVGAIMAFATLDPPSGWLVCDGRTINAVSFPQLYNAIGTYFGGLGKLPDLRGEFIRGYDSRPSNLQVDVNREFGSNQAATGILSFPATNTTGIEISNPDSTTVTSTQTTRFELQVNTGPDSFKTMRPRNVALLYCIKH